MGKLDTLIQLLAYLQHDIQGAEGCSLLLNYLRMCGKAEMGLLFLRDTSQHNLVLLEASGCPSCSSISSSSDDVHITLPLTGLVGLVGSALATTEWLEISDVGANTRMVQEERDLFGDVHSLLFKAIGEHGVLVLGFGVEHTAREALSLIDEDTLLICTTLIAAYLADPEIAPLIMQHYAMRMKEQQAVIEQERTRIARDIHDGAAQYITHAIHKLEFIERILEQQPMVALSELDYTSALLQQSLHDIHQSIISLLPARLESQGLNAALESLLAEYRVDEPRIHISREIDALDSLPSTLESAIFRLIQEALTNVRKHAQASSISIRIRAYISEVFVEVADNGRGFDTAEMDGQSDQHLGLRVMRERMQQASGRLEIFSTQGKGTRLLARFPLSSLVPLSSPSTVLTNREREVLRLLIEGYTNRTIAEKLSVSTETVKSHVHHIMQKMNAKDRTHAAVIATRQQLV